MKHFKFGYVAIIGRRPTNSGIKPNFIKAGFLGKMETDTDGADFAQIIKARFVYDRYSEKYFAQITYRTPLTPTNTNDPDNKLISVADLAKRYGCSKKLAYQIMDAVPDAFKVRSSGKTCVMLSRYKECLAVQPFLAATVKRICKRLPYAGVG